MQTRSKTKKPDDARSKAPSVVPGGTSEGTARTESSRSSATVRAHKAAAEAQALRQRLEREQALAARELERERQLAALQQQVADSELQAEICAIEANAGSSHAGSCRSHRSSNRVSVDRTERWVENAVKQTSCSVVKGDIPAVECEHVFAPGHSVQQPPATATRATASPLSQLLQQNIIPLHSCDVTKASKAPGLAPPLIPMELDNTCLLKAVADTAAAAKALACAHSSKKLELFPFSGNSQQWLHFKRIYDTTKRNFSDLENIIRLQNALCGSAREAVAALLMSTEDPEEVMRALEENFARPELIVFKEVTALKSLPRLGNDLKELGTFSNRIRNSISTIKLLKQTEYLYSPELFHAVLGKLNPTTKIRWTDFAVRDTTGRPKLEILSDFLNRELNQHIRFGLSPDSSLFQNFYADKPFVKRENVHSLSHAKPTTPPQQPISTTKQECVFCKKNHNIKSCSEFKVLSVDDRWQWQRNEKVCYRCLKRSSHQWKTCKVNPCGISGCLLRHHPLLHGQTASSYINTTIETQIMNDNDLGSHPTPSCSVLPEEQVNVANTSQQPEILLTLRPPAYLKIVPVTVYGPAGSCDVFALLDDGSTATVIDSSIANRIGVTGPQQTIIINAIGGLTRRTTISYVDFKIKGRDTHDTFLIRNVRSLDDLSLKPQTIKPETVSQFSHLIDLVDKLSYEDALPSILIGTEHWFLSVNHDVRFGGRNEPVACLSALGWSLYGVASSKTNLVEFVNHATILESSVVDENLDSLIKQQYKIDSLGISKNKNLNSKLDQRAVEILDATSKRLPSGRYEVGLPWRENIKHVPDSYPQAMSRFLSLERRMRKDSEFAKAYSTFMNNVINKGYAEECDVATYHCRKTDDTFNTIRWYLPTFGVYHPQKKKLRVVHDAAASTNGVSLNSLLLTGPDLLQPLLGILFRFREGKVAITGDIREMFPQIKIRDQDRDAQRFLWRDVNSTTSIKEYRMSSMTFGAASSPCTAIYIKNKNALEFESQYPEAANEIVHNHYMDDFISSFDSLDDASRIAGEVLIIHSKCSFEMRAWISNDINALSCVPKDLWACPDADVQIPNQDIGALGVKWNPLSDMLGFRVGDSNIDGTITKRKVLSRLMSVYDPLGLLGPIVVKGRILFQQTWRLNVGWDTELSPSEVTKWLDWFQELAQVSSLQIPRWYSKSKNSEPLERELHVFADASELSYACVAYWRLLYPNGRVELALISSKARVSPLKPISIPRLELQAALIASRLAVTIKDSHRNKPIRTSLWSDSMTVLQWLRSDARSFKPFVAHRLGEILENSYVNDWHWVPTNLNVADDATRMRPISLTVSHRWFQGPSFLLESPENWPMEPANIPPVREELKCMPSESVGLTSVASALPNPLTVNFGHFSNWIRLVRATARLHQATALFGDILIKIRDRKSNGEPFQPRRATTSTTLSPSPLSAEIMKAAERHILQRTQLDSFPEEFRCLLNSLPLPKNNRLKKLSPSLAQDGLLRLTGRINAVKDVDPDTRSPVILDGGHPVVRLLVQNYHRRAGHANNELVVNELRQRFWLLQLRATVRSVAKQCLFCRIRKDLPLRPTIGDLPPGRLAHHQRPFTYTGLDYFGPIMTTIGRRHEKRYVALYTCLTTRAIHLELVHSLSADSAMMSLRRFVARRGAPDTLFSDNGTAFVGANRILKEFYSNAVLDLVATKGIKWSFIPPAAPNFGGSWERLVRTVKVALHATLKERAPKEETLLTLLSEAEAIVNSRPLTYVSTDPQDPTTLTPFHFLIGASSDQVSPNSFDDHDLVRRSEWRKAVRLADHFWHRWVREILPTMQPRDRNSQNQTLSIGDSVLIVDESLPRGTWPRGRIAKEYPGKDGITRVVDVETAGGCLRRPLRKLIKIPT